jgi:hypothetical protein
MAAQVRGALERSAAGGCFSDRRVLI